MAEEKNWTIFHARLHQLLRDRQLLPANQRVLLAVSGGQDSLCLTQLLFDLQSKWGWDLAIAHLDHRWRSDSATNAEHVHQLANDLALPFYLETAHEIPKTEAAAREWRYKTLEIIAQTHHYRFLVTGHTASDRAETLIYNLVRGSGMDGLQALTWCRKLTSGLTLVRPLLAMARHETAEICQAFNRVFWEDTTNQDLKYARNRIRQELIPYLKQQFNPQVETVLAQTAELLQAEVEYLEAEANHLRTQMQHPTEIGLRRDLLRSIPLALQRRIIRQFLSQQLPCAPSFEQIDKFFVLINAPNRSRSDPFPGERIAEVQDQWIFLVSNDGKHQLLAASC